MVKNIDNRQQKAPQSYQPDYLDDLDKNPEKTFEGFYKDLVALLAINPPHIYRSLCKEDIEDLLQVIAIHCVGDDFRVLRKYKNIGKPFLAWLYVVCCNLVRDYIRKNKKQVDADPDPESRRPRIEDTIPDPNPITVEPHVWKEWLDAAFRAIEKLDPLCKVSLKLKAEGYTFEEILKLLRPKIKSMKSLYSKIDHCRKKLKDLMFLDDYDISELFG